LIAAIAVDDTFEEFKAQAQAAKIEAMAQLGAMHIAAMAAQDAAARVAQCG
jgi:hypothetical protein